MKSEFFDCYNKMRNTITVTDEQSEKMTEFCNKASYAYDKNHDEYFDESSPAHANVRKQVHDLHEAMIRVVFPDYILPEEYSFPQITHDKPTNYYDVFPSKRAYRLAPSSYKQLLPTNKGWGFSMKFEKIWFHHPSGMMETDF